MAEVVRFPGITRIPDDPSVALEKAKYWGMSRVVIVGWDADGALIFGGSHSELAETMLLLELAKKRLLETVDV